MMRYKLKYYYPILKVLCISVALFISCKSSNTSVNNKSWSATGLSVECIREPESVLIVDINPEFAWELPNSEQKQLAYQVLVASSKELIKKDIGDVWNSERVMSSQCINIEFKGTPLLMNETYFWKVKLWNENNEESQFSKEQSFSIGQSKNTITSANRLQIDSIQPITFKKTNTNSYFIDFGKAAFANLQFQYTTKEIDTLVFHIGEQLTNNNINRKPRGTIRYQKINVPVGPQKQKYILPIQPDKRNTKPEAVQLPDSFPVIMPFRYVELENMKGNVVAGHFTQLAYHSYWEGDKSYFKSSDTILNQVWGLCKYSIKATTFAGLYVDGDRERIPYEADAYLNQLSHYTNDREYAMARQTIEYFMEQPTWPTEWQLHVALMFYADYMYTGNTELIEKYYEKLKYKTLMKLRREDGLINSSKATPEFMKKLGFKNPKAKLKDIVDWPPAQKDTGWKLATKEGERDGFVFTPINTVINCLYYRNLEIIAEFAQLLNKPEEATQYRELAAKVKISINNKLLDKNRGVYKDGEDTNHASLHSNMMALAFDIVPKKYTKSVAAFIKSRGMACSVYGAQYLLEALYNAEESEYALELMTAIHDRSWYNMIKIGSTITLEAWDMKYKPNSDWNHAWGAAPANIIPRHLWGIQPKKPGYTLASINPQFGNLTSSSIIVPTIRGQIKAEYIFKADNTKKYIIEIPANMEAEFKVKETSKVTINNIKQPSNTNLLHLKPGRYIIEISE